MTKLRRTQLLALLLAPTVDLACVRQNYNLRMHPMQSVAFGHADGMGHYPGDGGVVLLTSRDGAKDYKSIVCVAPPSQAAVTVDTGGPWHAGRQGQGRRGRPQDLRRARRRPRAPLRPERAHALRADGDVPLVRSARQWDAARPVMEGRLRDGSGRGPG